MPFQRKTNTDKQFPANNSDNFQLEQLICQSELETPDMPPILYIYDYKEVLSHFERTGDIPAYVLDNESIGYLKQNLKNMSPNNPNYANTTKIVETWG